MPTTVRVEFYGIPRERARVDSVEITVADSIQLGDLLRQLADRFPHFAPDCMDGGLLRSNIAANVDGQRFVTDPETTLVAGMCLLLMSADGGG